MHLLATAEAVSTALRLRQVTAALITLCILLVVIPPSPALAQASSTVVISEIFYNPDGQAEGHEFVELHNTLSSSIDVSGWRFLTGIDYTFPPGASIEANSYVVLAADAADFETVFGFAPTGDFDGSLSNGGESLTLVSATNALIDQVIYDDVAPWPLTPDGAGDSLVGIDPDLAPDDPAGWVAGSPTPQVANNPVLAVLFSVQRGWYASTQTVTLTPSIAGATIFYNTSGSGAATIEYTGPITVSDNNDVRVIQAQASVNGQASELSTHTYVFKNDTGAPVVATWPNGLAVAPGETEVTRSFEFIPPPSTGLTAAWGNAGVKASEGGIDAGDSDKFFFRSAYGNGTLTADMFGDNYFGLRPSTDVDQLFLRNQHLDGTHLRQIAAQDALLATGQLSPHGRFVQYYKEGASSGPRHMQERPEGGFMESYTGIDKGNWAAWSTHETTPGTGTSNGLGVATLGAPFSSWDAAEQAINTESLIDYLLVQWQAKVSDYRNIKNFRIAGPTNYSAGDSGDYRFHFFNWDMDLGYNNNLYGRGGPTGWGWAGYTSPDYIAHELDQFVQFRLLASDRIACAFFDNGPLSQSAFSARLEDRRQELVAAGGANQQAFTSGLAQWITSRNDWLVDEFRSPGADRTVFGVNRPDTDPWKPPTSFAGPLLQADTPLDVSVDLGVLAISNTNGGQVYYRTDGGDPRTPSGSLSPDAIAYQGPVGLLAGRHEIIARSFNSNAGDTFQAWSPACNEATVVDVAVSGDPGASPGDGLRISELHYNPVPASDPEYLELLNTTDAPINVSGFSFSTGIDFTFLAGTTIAAGDHFVIARSAPVHATEYGSAANGEFTGRLDDGGETVTLVDAVGAEIDSVTYDDALPWPTLSDGNGPSLSRIDPSNASTGPDAWKISRSPGTPGRSNDVGMKGDANCDGRLDTLDAVVISQYIVGTRTGVDFCAGGPQPFDPATMAYVPETDFNRDGITNVFDPVQVSRCFVGLPSPICE